MNSYLKRVVAVILLMLGVMFGLVDVSWAFDFINAKAAERWPSVQGKIVRSEVVAGCKHDYQILMEYVFEVDGHSYGGHRLAFGPAGCLTESKAYAVQARYPEGLATIYYEKNVPNNAILLTGRFLPEAMPGVRICIALALIPLIIASVLLISLWKGSRSSIVANHLPK